MKELEPKMDCQPDQIATYLDNELSGAALEDFEAHMKTCSSCRAELRMQQQLLCTLDAAFRSGVELPTDFTRIVKARAESDVRGMREKTERRRALQVTALLAAASAMAYSGGSSQIGRTSIDPSLAAGILAAVSIASSRSRASIR